MVPQFLLGERGPEDALCHRPAALGFVQTAADVIYHVSATLLFQAKESCRVSSSHQVYLCVGDS